MNTIQTNTQYWKNKYLNVFSDKIGKLKNFQLKFHIDKSVKPVQAKQRNHPFHLKAAIEEEIQRLLDEDIIEEVRNEPSEWLSETVNIPKVGTNKVRICIDMKAANRAVIREKYLMPDVDNIIYKANGMKFFNKIDLNRAFQQIELHPASRPITRFRTHRGIFQSKRLVFGVSSAPEIFNNTIQKILEGIPAMVNATDDILVMGKTEEESNQNVDKVLKRLDEHGLTVNEAKCQFNKSEITFFGLHFTEKGVSLNETKTKALN